MKSLSMRNKQFHQNVYVKLIKLFLVPSSLEESFTCKF